MTSTTTGTLDSTPLMKQYGELKAQAGDALLLFRMGDFYELFGEDAVEAARILEITLTSRDKNKPNPIPMAGVPHHSVAGYIQKLLAAGRKVAIGEQMEDPSQVVGRGIVKREIIRTFTPGIQFDLEGTQSNYIAALARLPDSKLWIMALLDASTGETLLSDPLELDAVQDEILGRPVRQILTLGPSVLKPAGVLVEELPTHYLSPTQARDILLRQFGLAHLESFVPSEAAVSALGLAVAYALRTQRQERLAHLRLPSPLREPDTMVLGPRTVQHLDLLTTDGSPDLFGRIQRTRSALGSRQLKRWMLSPLKSPLAIATRQGAVRELSQARSHLQGRLAAELSNAYDLERISGRVNAKLANPRDTRALGQTIAKASVFFDLLKDSRDPELQRLANAFQKSAQALGPMAQRILTTQKEDAPLLARDGGIFNAGTDPELDRLLSLSENGQKWLIDLEARERDATKIPSLKVRYNRVFGYYIEVTQAHAKNVPAHYQRKQTTVGAERFFTEELKKFEDEFVTASSRQKALELDLFERLLGEIQSLTAAVMECARSIGELDSLLSLALLANEPGWCFPVIDDSIEIEIRAGRHPLVDVNGEFVPNDMLLGARPDLGARMTLMITGPNMGGKSTIMRQTALIVLLGQMGSPIPAASARWGAVSSIYTRIGAHDAIARGQSTFMVEMSELAHILHRADSRSLILMDEIGRGTSTYDGISVAWATLEWICTQVRARTLFATHYHELTKLTAELPALANAHMAVAQTSESAESLRFLYQLRDGPTGESFGIHVARLAGLPSAVVERAWKVLEELESSARMGHQGGSDPAQLSLFAAAAAATPSPPAAPPVPEPVRPHPVLLELERANLNEMTPIQALNFVVQLQKSCGELPA